VAVSERSPGIKSRHTCASSCTTTPSTSMDFGAPRRASSGTRVPASVESAKHCRVAKQTTINQMRDMNGDPRTCCQHIRARARARRPHAALAAGPMVALGPTPDIHRASAAPSHRHTEDALKLDDTENAVVGALRSGASLRLASHAQRIRSRVRSAERGSKGSSPATWTSPSDREREIAEVIQPLNPCPTPPKGAQRRAQIESPGPVIPGPGTSALKRSRLMADRRLSSRPQRPPTPLTA
jgi:hypothetical protein